MDIKTKLTTMLKQHGASLVGFSDISGIEPQRRSGLTSAVTIACALDKEAVKGIKGAPTIDYYEEYKRKNELLDELGRRCADFLGENGYEAQALPATEVGIDENLETAFPHKTGAVLSALGWIGKCALLITPQYGSAVRLTSVFTSLPCENGEVMAERCGSCSECVDNCPGLAVTGENWSRGAQRSSIYDAFACQQAAREKAALIGIRNTICGICIASCPWTVRYVNSGG